MIRTAHLPALVACSLLGACTSSNTFVLQHPPHDATLQGVSIKPLDHTVNIDQEAEKTFRDKLNAQITKKLGIQPSDDGDLQIQYRFTLFERGNTAKRLGSGAANLLGSPFYGWGDGNIGVEIVYARPDGSRIGHIVTDGPIAGALGSTSAGLDSVTASIASYTKANFTCPSCGALGVVAQNPAPQPYLQDAP